MNYMQTPQTLKGFRDLLPNEKRQRDTIIKKIKTVFESYGFEPLESPTLEYSSLLLGKYGNEADKLVYTFDDRGGRNIGLRYDQTVPTARILSQYQSQLPKFFRRYQIQNVFRADKPQKGRYREFTQCDIDIFGSTNPLSDAEVIACTYDVFKSIGFPTIIIKINDRQLLFSTLLEFETKKVSTLSIIQSLDKIDKIGQEGTYKELIKKGLSTAKASSILDKINSQTPSNSLSKIIDYAKDLGVPAKSIEFTPSLARGLDYYTGMIFEVIIPEYPVGSFGGGGRYDNLISDLGGPKTAAVGIAYGLDRIIEASIEMSLVENVDSTSRVLVTIMDQSFTKKCLSILSKLRKSNIPSEIYLETNDNLGKQISLANKKKIPYVIIYGEEEEKLGKITLKNLYTGKQQKLSITETISYLKK